MPWKRAIRASHTTAYMTKFLTCTQPETISLSEHSLGQHGGLKGDGRIACLGLGSRWPPNGRQFGQLLHLPPGGIYRCQRSLATRAAASPQRLRQWKHGRSSMEGIDCLDDFDFLISLYSQCFILSYWFSFQCICLALKNWTRIIQPRLRMLELPLLVRSGTLWFSQPPRR